MNVTLAKAEHERAVYTESLRKQGEFFKRNPSSFRGEKKTFHAAEGQLEDPTKVGHIVAATTVSEEIIHNLRGIRLMVDHGHTSIKLKYSESYRPTWGPGRRIRIPTQAAYFSG